MGRVESIFYRRNEDALSYAFLALIDRLSPKIRELLFNLISVNLFNTLGDYTGVYSQSKLSDSSRPDGLLLFADGIVVFENKVLIPHTGEQMRNYFRQVSTDFDQENIKILLAVDQDVQGKAEIESEAERNRISRVDFDILTWQNACVICRNLLSSKEHTRIMNDVDRFLIDEFYNLLEDMELDVLPYEGLKGSELKTFVKAWEQLERLERYLNRQIPREFTSLDTYRRNDIYSSLFKTHLAYHFKKASGKTKGEKYTYVYLKLREDINNLEFGVRADGEKDLRKLRRNLDLRELAKNLATLGNYSLSYGGEFENSISGKSVSEIYNSLSEASGMFSIQIAIHRAVPFKDLEAEFGLNTPEFPDNIRKEIHRLKSIIDMFNDAL